MKTKKNLTLKKTRITKLTNLKTIKGGDDNQGDSYSNTPQVAENDSYSTPTM